MRLTLRTLLAYLDDTLDPTQTKQIGQKVAESDSAQELIARIRQVARRRRLTTPDADPSAPRVDPNTVAEYLDNVLSQEEVAQLERLALESDVHLAEVAACHQILTLILGEAMPVPPPAVRRMYGLVRGREASPHRQPPASVAAPAEPAEDADETPGPELPAIFQVTRRLPRWAAVAAMLALFAGLVGVLYLAVGRMQLVRPKAPIAAAPTGPSDNGDSTLKGLEARQALPGLTHWTTWLAARPAVPVGLFPHLAMQDVEKLPRPAERDFFASHPFGAPPWSGWSPSFHSDRPGPLVRSVSQWAGWMAARPALPANLALGFGAEEIVPLAAPPAVTLPPIEPPSFERVELGTYTTTVKERPSLLLAQPAAGDWRMLRLEERVRGGVPLMALPGYRAEIVTDNRLALDLAGNLPEVTWSPVLESVVVLHASDQVDLDVTLLRGRIVVANLRQQAPAKLRLRFHENQVWDVQLDPKARIGVELTGRVTRGSPAGWAPTAKVNLVTSDGSIGLRRTEKVERIPLNRLVTWDSSIPAELLGVVFPIPEAPEWLAKGELPPERVPPELKQFLAEVQAGLSAARQNLAAKVENARDQPQLPWMRLAFEEWLEGASPLENRLAAYCCGATDQVTMLLRALDHEKKPAAREAARAALLQWLGRRANQEDSFRQLLDAQLRQENRTYNLDDLTVILRLVRGMDNPTTLMGYLGKQHRLAVRELAIVHLRALVPPGRTVPAYDPAGPETERERGIEAWKAYFMNR